MDLHNCLTRCFDEWYLQIHRESFRNRWGNSAEAHELSHLYLDVVRIVKESGESTSAKLRILKNKERHSCIYSTMHGEAAIPNPLHAMRIITEEKR